MPFPGKASPPPAIVRLWLLRLVLRTPVIERFADDWPDARICTALDLSLASVKRESKLRERLEPDLAKAESLPLPGDTISKTSNVSLNV